MGVCVTQMLHHEKETERVAVRVILFALLSDTVNSIAVILYCITQYTEFTACLLMSGAYPTVKYSIYIWLHDGRVLCPSVW